ncbi:MAG: PAS domain S-box protein [Candidatus Promineofilum sp.]|nr:PAS domain S-box protein [Promineifilum sp.]
MDAPLLESAVLEPGSLLHRVFRDSPVGMAIISAADGDYVDVNDAFAELLGYTRAEILDPAFAGAGPSIDRELIFEIIRYREPSAVIPITISHRDGFPLACAVSVQLELIDQAPYFFIIIQDFTSQQQTAVALEHYENRFRFFFRSVPLPLLVVDDQTFRIIDVNPAACDLYGYSYEEFISLSLNSLLPPDGWVIEAAVDGPAPQSGSATYIRQLLKDGRIIEVKATSYSFVLDGRRASLSIMQDVTERRAALATLAANEERLRLIAELTAGAIREYDLRTNIVKWSAGLEKLFGYRHMETSTLDWWFHHIHPDDRPVVGQAIEAVRRTKDIYWMVEYRFLRADGSYANVLDNGYLLRDSSNDLVWFIGSMVDITEQLAMVDVDARATLEERQRLAHILHESVTQSLYSISLLAEAARRRAASGDHEMVADYVGRLTDLTMQTLRQMRLLIYDLQPGVLVREGLAGALRHRLEAVEHRAGIKARLIDDTPRRFPAVLKAEVFWMAQEVLNNSLRHATATQVTVRLALDAGQAILEITDDGRGFDPALLEEAGGLAAIRRRVTELEGRFSLETHRDEGTLVRICLPLSEVS